MPRKSKIKKTKNAAGKQVVPAENTVVTKKTKNTAGKKVAQKQVVPAEKKVVQKQALAFLQKIQNYVEKVGEFFGVIVEEQYQRGPLSPLPLREQKTYTPDKGPILGLINPNSTDNLKKAFPLGRAEPCFKVSGYTNPERDGFIGWLKTSVKQLQMATTQIVDYYPENGFANTDIDVTTPHQKPLIQTWLKMQIKFNETKVARGLQWQTTFKDFVNRDDLPWAIRSHILSVGIAIAATILPTKEKRDELEVHSIINPNNLYDPVTIDSVCRGLPVTNPGFSRRYWVDTLGNLVDVLTRCV